MADRPANGHWTVETLREFVLDKFNDLEKLSNVQEKLNDQRIKNVEATASKAEVTSNNAISKAESATEKRLEQMNEWRKTVGDITGGLASKDELKALAGELSKLTTRFERFESGSNRQEGDTRDSREQRGQSTQLTLMAVGIVVSILISAAGFLHTAGGAPAVPQVVYVPTPPATTAPTAR